MPTEGVLGRKPRPKFELSLSYRIPRISQHSGGIRLSGGIGIKILGVVDWSQVSNQWVSKLLQASSRFLKQQPEPESVVTGISR